MLERAVERLGPQTTSLFGNLIPVSTFAIETIRGHRPSTLELVGALITVGALVANTSSPEAESQPADQLLEAA